MAEIRVTTGGPGDKEAWANARPHSAEDVKPLMGMIVPPAEGPPKQPSRVAMDLPLPDTVPSSGSGAGTLIGLLVVAALVAGFFIVKGGMPFGGGALASMPLEKAAVQAHEQGKLMVVEFSADWCGACKQMEATSWRDGRVKAWLEKNAVAVRVDVDADRSVGQQWNFRSIPTVVALKDGREIARTGFEDPGSLLAWLEAARVAASEKP